VTICAAVEATGAACLECPVGGTLLSARRHAQCGTLDVAMLKAWELPVLAGVAGGHACA